MSYRKWEGLLPNPTAGASGPTLTSLLHPSHSAPSPQNSHSLPPTSLLTIHLLLEAFLNEAGETLAVYCTPHPITTISFLFRDHHTLSYPLELAISKVNSVPPR